MVVLPLCRVEADETAKAEEEAAKKEERARKMETLRMSWQEQLRARAAAREKLMAAEEQVRHGRLSLPARVFSHRRSSRRMPLADSLEPAFLCP